MNKLGTSVENLRKKYREIFEKSVEEIQTRIDDIKPEDLTGDIFDYYESDSKGRQWQEHTVDMLENDISKEVYRKFQEILPPPVRSFAAGIPHSTTARPG